MTDRLLSEELHDMRDVGHGERLVLHVTRSELDRWIRMAEALEAGAFKENAADLRPEIIQLARKLHRMGVRVATTREMSHAVG